MMHRLATLSRRDTASNLVEQQGLLHKEHQSENSVHALTRVMSPGNGFPFVVYASVMYKEYLYLLHARLMFFLQIYSCI